MSNTPPRVPLITGREVTPHRVNSRSLPDSIQARLIVDADNNKSKLFNEHSLIWREEWKPYNRDRIRKRFQYIVRQKLFGNQTEWENTLIWAKDFQKNNGKSESTKMSECL